MKKVLGTILFVIYAIIAIAVTVLLLSYNDYNNSVIGEYTVYIVKDDSLEPEYKQGSILLIKETSDKNVNVGDKIFMYKVLSSSEYEVISTTLQAKSEQGRHTVYVVDNEESYASDYFIGKADDTIVIEGWGYILNILESRWGYLFCIVVVSLLLFLQEVFELVMEIKYLNAQKKKQKSAIEVEAEDEEYEEDDDEYDEDEEYEEEIVTPVRRATRAKSSQRTTATKSRTTSGTRTATKSATSKSKTATRTSAGTKTATKPAGTRTKVTSSGTRKAGTTSKTAGTRKTTTKTSSTATRKPRTTKSKEE